MSDGPFFGVDRTVTPTRLSPGHERPASDDDYNEVFVTRREAAALRGLLDAVRVLFPPAKDPDVQPAIETLGAFCERLPWSEP